MTTYIDTYEHRRLGPAADTVCTHSWAEHTLARLEWLYGPERAKAIVEGRDPATNRDLVAWTRLGRRSAA